MVFTIPLHAVSQQHRYCPPGVIHIAVIDPNDMLVQPNWSATPQIIDPLQFKPGKFPYSFPIVLLGSLRDNTREDNQGGDLFDYELNVSLRNIRFDVEFLRAKIINRRVHVLVTQYDAQQRIVPNMILRSSSDSGQRGRAQGYEFTGRATHRKPAPFIVGAFTIITQVPVPPTAPPDTGTPGGVTVAEVTTTGTAAHQFTLPAGKLLMCVVFESASAQTVSLGTTPGGNELGGPAEGVAGQQVILGDNMLRTSVATTLHFSGLVGVNTIRIYYR